MQKIFLLLIVSLIALGSINSSADILPVGPVQVVGRQLMVDSQPYIIKGVGYNPYPVGVFPSQYGTCEYCSTVTDCLYPGGGADKFSCSAETDLTANPPVNAGPQHPWGGQPCGGTEPYPNKCANLFDRGDVNLDRDFQNLVSMNVNTIRTWEKVTPSLLAKANQYGLKVIAGYWIGNLFDPTGRLANTQHIIDDFANYISHMKNDPNFSAVLFIAIGNENNYMYYAPGAPRPSDAPGCYMSPSGPADTNKMAVWYALANQLACRAHSITDRPVALVNGDISEINNSSFGTTDANMTCLDIWGANVYRGISFGGLFSSYASKSQKPFWISEAGVDALYTNNFYDDYSTDHVYDPTAIQEDEVTQASWMGRQWDEVVKNLNVTIGATFFEYSDEYWKANGRIPDSFSWDSLSRQHNNAGQCFQYTPSPGAMPDGFLNQEWFGIMKVQENGNQSDKMLPRQVYGALKVRFQCGGATIYYAGPSNSKSCDGSSACCFTSSQRVKAGACVSSCPIKYNKYKVVY